MHQDREAREMLPYVRRLTGDSGLALGEFPISIYFPNYGKLYSKTSGAVCCQNIATDTIWGGLLNEPPLWYDQRRFHYPATSHLYGRGPHDTSTDMSTEGVSHNDTS